MNVNWSPSVLGSGAEEGQKYILNHDGTAKFQNNTSVQESDGAIYIENTTDGPKELKPYTGNKKYQDVFGKQRDRHNGSPKFVYVYKTRFQLNRSV